MIRRYQFIDILKGIAILLIVYGHIIPGFIVIFTNYVATFNIPLFFFVSGILFNEKKYQGQFDFFLKTRIQGLMIPFLYLSLIVLCGYYFLEIDRCKFAIHVLLYGWGGYALWFVPVLFLVELFYYPLSYIKTKMRCICLLMIVMLSFISCKMYGYIPYNILLVFCGIYFYGLGNLCRPLLNIVSYIKNYQLVLIFFIGLIVSLAYYPTSTVLPEWFINKIPSIIFYVTPLAAIIMLTAVSILIEKWTNKYINVFLATCGKQSLIILAFHQIICLLLQQNLSSKLAILLMILILMLLVILIPRYTPWLLGKNR